MSDGGEPRSRPNGLPVATFRPWERRSPGVTMEVRWRSTPWKCPRHLAAKPFAALEQEFMLPQCARCDTPFHAEKSQSALRFRYCGIFCEQADLGFSIEALLRAEAREETQAQHDPFAGEWLDELLARLPAAAREVRRPLGFRPGWIMYGPVHEPGPRRVDRS